MKLDVFSVVIFVFCVGVCITLGLEVKSTLKVQKAEVVAVESH